MGGWEVAFTNPALWAGGFALFAPYFVHLLTRRTPRRIVFPTVRFLKRAEANQSALYRMRDWLLLAVRTACVLFLLAAFLKPVLRASAMEEDVKETGASIVVVDASLSMAYTGTGFSPFGRAQMAVERVLDRLKSGEAANVILARAFPIASFDTPADNPQPLKRDVRDAKASLERADIDAAIMEAIRQLEGYAGRSRSIYFISDFQRTNWAAAKFASIPEDVKLVFVPVHEQTPSNLAVTNISIRPRAPVAHEETEIVCKVANYGDAPVKSPAVLELEEIAGATPAPDRNARMERAVTLGPRETASISFRLRPRHSGSFRGVLRFGEDGLPYDNARYFTLNVSERIEVLLVSDEPPNAQSAARFLQNALEPYSVSGKTGDATLGTIRTTLVRSTGVDLSSQQPQVIVVAKVGAWTERTAQELAAYLAHGGAVVYFLSSVVDKANLMALASASKGAFAPPFTLGNVIDPRSGDPGFAVFAEANFDEPMLRRFRESGEISSIRFLQYLATERNRGQGRVLIRYGDGNIAMAAAPVDLGKLLLCNFSVARGSSDLAQRTIFVPLVHEMVKGFRPHEGAAAEYVVGGPASGAFALPYAGADVRFVSPSGEAISATTNLQGEKTAVMFSSTEEVGFYRITAEDKEAGAIAVNVDPRESDFEVIEVGQLEQLAAAPARKLAHASGNETGAIARLLDGIPVWHYLLFAALCLLGVEQALLYALKR